MALKPRPIKASKHHRQLVRLVLSGAFPDARVDEETIQAVAQRVAERIGVIERGYAQERRTWTGHPYLVLPRIGACRHSLKERVHKEVSAAFSGPELGWDRATEELRRSSFPAVLILRAPKGSGRA